MKHSKLPLALVTVLVLLVLSVSYLRPHLRAKQSNSEVRFEVALKDYECADGHCTFFEVVNANAHYSEFVGTTLIPYLLDVATDTLQEELYSLAQVGNTHLCVRGFVHLYSEGTLRLFNVNSHGHRFRLGGYTEGKCEVL
ncbi:hypothetical protein EZV61_17305 [Corallincola luteus]|uniref:Uncharacterized protein n=1 Tax=Corallincola luteus TaxID=1775177 RepID=A0ABY2AGS5_9GAMM|nr:hypothetical protein [Corallincola luteus]TCI01728.1 hypothetical protein EZV61_17305 [Corallincola luteus]